MTLGWLSLNSLCLDYVVVVLHFPNVAGFGIFVMSIILVVNPKFRLSRCDMAHAFWH